MSRSLNFTGLILSWNASEVFDANSIAFSPVLSLAAMQPAAAAAAVRFQEEESDPDISEFTRLVHEFEENRTMDFFFALFSIALIIDIALYGLDGSYNSNWIAFLDSISHCSSWLAVSMGGGGGGGESGKTTELKILGALLSKSVSGLITSTLFGFPPPFSQTFSVVSFIVAMILCYNVSSLPQHVRASGGPWRLLFVCMSALHKSRKLRSVMKPSDRRPRAAGEVLVLGLLTIELTGWVTVALRSYWSDGRDASLVTAAQAVLAFAFHNRLRLIITLAAIIAVRFESNTVLLLLALHKSAVPNKDGSQLAWW